MVSHSEFLKQRLGENYVVVHRVSKQPRFDRRGFEQQQVTYKQHNEAERAWRELYGDPYDKQRAELYLAAKDARLMLYAWKAARKNMGLSDDHRELDEVIARIEAAITTEAGAGAHSR